MTPPGVERRGDRRQEEEAKELHTLMAKHHTNQLIKSLAIAAFCLFTILGVLAYGIINTNNRARESAILSERGVACLIEQFAEHRQNDKYAHREIAKGPLDFPNPTLVPDDLKVNIQKACEGFLK